MNYKIMFLISGVVIFFLLGVFVYEEFGVLQVAPETENPVNSNAKSKPVEFGIAEEKDYSNFEEILSKNKMIQDLPKDGIILIKFYNYYSGERTWEKQYTLTKEAVNLGVPEKNDILLILDSKYLTILNSNNFCSVIQLAQKNGDFGYETKLGTTALLWKYRGMMSHKDCLG